MTREEAIEKRKQECPWLSKLGNNCTRYEEITLFCNCACSWIVDYIKAL